jgi:hypothetical protein
LKQERTRKLLAAIGLVVTLSTFSCGSDDDKESGTCDSICDCVVAQLGASARAQCNTECAEALRSEDPNGECEARLAANGVSSCDSRCPPAGPDS